MLFDQVSSVGSSFCSDYVMNYYDIASEQDIGEVEEEPGVLRYLVRNMDYELLC